MATRISSILGPDGKPVEVDTDSLGREVAAPTLGGVRSILSGHPAQGLDPRRLAMIMRNAENGDADAYYDLAEEIEEKYLHYQGVLGTRKRAVSQLPITINAASDDPRHQKDADLIRMWIERDTLEAEMFDILDAIGKGFSATEMVWNTRKVPWYPIDLINRNQKWFEFDQTDGETLRLKGGPDGLSGLPTDLQANKFIIHRHKAKTGLTVRGGLARGVAWAYLFQNFAIKDWVIFAEVFGMPIRLGKYDPTASDQDRRALLRAVTGIATDAAAIIPKSMEIEFVDGMASGNADVFERLCIYLDQQVSKAVLGQTGTSDATTGGFGSSGAVHNDVREDIQRADARALASTFQQVIRPIVDFNHGPPPGDLYPRVRIGEAEFLSKEDMEKIQMYVAMGGRVETSVVRDKLGLPDPPKGNDVELLTVPGPAQNPAPQTPAEGGGATEGAKLAATRLLALLSPLNRPFGGDPILIAAAKAEAEAKADAIDTLIDQIGGEDGSGWVEVMAPMLGPIEDIIEAATSFDDLKDRLIAAMGRMDPSKLAEQLATAQFNARLAGEAGEDIHAR
jgi:phage gp29-like protein